MKPLKEIPSKARRKYDPAFKLEAVQNWLASGKSAEVVAEELGITSGRLFAWRRRLTQTGVLVPTTPPAKPVSTSDLQSQLDAAHRELRHVREQCQILKKTLGILSEPSPNASNGYGR